MFGKAFDFLKGMGGGAGGAAPAGGGFAGFGDRLKNFGVSSDMRGQMGQGRMMGRGLRRPQRGGLLDMGGY